MPIGCLKLRWNGCGVLKNLHKVRNRGEIEPGVGPRAYYGGPKSGG